MTHRVVVYASQLARPRAVVEEGPYDPTNEKHLGVCDAGRTVFLLRNADCLDYIKNGARMIFAQGCMTHVTSFRCSFMAAPNVVSDCRMWYDDDADRFVIRD